MRKGQNWAIVVGINHYTNLQDLLYAERDAASVRDFFRELKFKQVDFFAKGADSIPADHWGQSSAEPTFGELTNFLDRRFAAPFLEPSDNLWFFFAGHGLRVREQDYLMLKDSNPGNVDRAALKVQDLAAQLRGSGAGNVILLLDACRNTGLGMRNGLGGIERGQQGVITFYSCAPRQSSYEIDELSSGAFTHVLLKGLKLRGEADNCATVDRLARHLETQVPILVKQYKKGMVQNPLLALDPDSKRDAILLPELAQQLDVQMLKNHAYKYKSRGDCDIARELWIQVLAVSPADSDAIEEIERLASGKSSGNFSSIAQTVWRGVLQQLGRLRLAVKKLIDRLGARSSSQRSVEKNVGGSVRITFRQSTQHSPVVRTCLNLVAASLVVGLSYMLMVIVAQFFAPLVVPELLAVGFDWGRVILAIGLVSLVGALCSERDN
jgi:Caspase domain